jgi:hypothetical protein
MNGAFAFAFAITLAFAVALASRYAKPSGLALYQATKE